MYLIEIDINTGLILDDPAQSGWMAIKEFRDVYKKHGKEGITLIALSRDYLSPFRLYNNKERPYRAMEEIYGSRDKFDLTQELFVKASQKYDDLQFNSDLEQERLNEEITHRLLSQMRDANQAEDDTAIARNRKAMQDHQKYVESFKSSFSREEAVKKAVTTNGYELSRIENDIKSRKNSKFKNPGEDFKNPNKLGLSS